MFYATKMHTCIIHKGRKNSGFKEEHLKPHDFSTVQEIFLEEEDLMLLKKIDCDLIIFNAISYDGEITDPFIIRRIREIKKMVPIFLMTHSNTTASYRESMLDEGVDGCVQAPFSHDEFRLRIEKLFKKRNSLLFSGTVIDIRDVCIDIRNHIVKKGGEVVHLTKTEYGILLHLFLHKNLPVSSDNLTQCLGHEILEHSSAINIHILNLRKKLGGSGVIRTIPHYGFSITDSIYC